MAAALNYVEYISMWNDITCAIYDGQQMSTDGTAEPELFQCGRHGELNY